MSELIGIQKVTMTNQLTEQLRKDILLGRVEPGSRLTVRSVSSRYGISPIPVREAIHTLCGERLLTTDPYKGASVCTIDKTFISNMYDILRSMEVLIIESIQGHFTPALRDQVILANSEIKALETEEAVSLHFNVLNRRFHDPLEQFCTNDRAMELRSSYHHCITILAENSRTHTVKRVKEAAREHDDIIAALDSGDMHQLRMAYTCHSVNAEKELFRQLYGS